MGGRQHNEIREVRYTPLAQDAVGVEVISFAELRRRISGSGPVNRAERPDFHLLIHVTAGTVSHMVDFHDYALAAGSWLWVRPGQIQRFVDLANASGSVVLFPPDALAPNALLGSPLGDPYGCTLSLPGGADAEALEHGLAHLSEEFHSDGLPAHARSAVLHHLLTALLLRLTHYAATSGDVGSELTDTFVRFRAAVEQSFCAHRDVAHYSKQLGYAPRTLTRATLAAAGIGAKEFIDRRVVLEAKRLLVHTDEPAASVALKLGFPDASNFVKFFMLRADVTPIRFREMFRAGVEGNASQP